MSYARIESYNDSKVVVSIGGLENPGRNYDCFRLYLDTTHMGWRDPTSDSYSNDAYVEFDITQTSDGRTTQAGYYTAHVYGVYNGREYEIPISGNAGIRIENGGGSNPPTPQPKEMTYIKLKRFISVEEDYVKIEIETNGYGDVYLVSVSKGWNLYDGSMGSSQQVGRDYISVNDLDSSGYFYGTVSYYPQTTDMSYFPSIPIGTCFLASSSGLTGVDYSARSIEFLCMSKYGNWSVYDGTYRTTLHRYNSGFSANVLSLSTVKDDWTRLVNMSFYLEATTYGTIEYAQYANYIPRSGDIITASMYNGLLDAVTRCCNRVGMSTDRLPRYANSNEIISKYFIYDIGQTVDNCLMIQRMNVNDDVLRRQ